MKLVAFNLSSGEVEIHQAGCADIKRNVKGSKRGHIRQEQVEFGTTDWPTKFDFCHDYWDNGILEEHEAEHGAGSFDVMQEMNFAPCCDSLPERPATSQPNARADKLAAQHNRTAERIAELEEKLEWLRKKQAAQYAAAMHALDEGQEMRHDRDHQTGAAVISVVY